MSTANLDHANLTAVPVGGTVHEDVMDKLYDISPEDRPLTDAIGTGEAGNSFKEWVREDLKAANPVNKRVDGSSSAGINDARTGERIGNHHQIMSKVVRVSDRARNADTIGTGDQLILQTMKRQKELRRDEEAAYVSRNIAIADDGNTTAGQLAGVGGWIGVNIQGVAATTSDRGAGAGADPILSGDPGGFPTTAAVAGTPRPLSESTVKAMMREAYLNGGNPRMAMSTPAGIEVFSDYLFTSSARVATIDSHADQGNRTNNSTGGGKSGGGIVAQGSVNIFVTNYGILELVPNRFQGEVAADVADLYLIDPDLWEKCYLQGYETQELARDGLAENREITVDATLICLKPEGNSIEGDIQTNVTAVV